MIEVIFSVAVQTESVEQAITRSQTINILPLISFSTLSFLNVSDSQFRYNFKESSVSIVIWCSKQAKRTTNITEDLSKQSAAIFWLYRSIFTKIYEIQLMRKGQVLGQLRLDKVSWTSKERSSRSTKTKKSSWFWQIISLTCLIRLWIKRMQVWKNQALTWKSLLTAFSEE